MTLHDMYSLSRFKNHNMLTLGRGDRPSNFSPVMQYFCHQLFHYVILNTTYYPNSTFTPTTYPYHLSKAYSYLRTSNRPKLLNQINQNHRPQDLGFALDRAWRSGTEFAESIFVQDKYLYRSIEVFVQFRHV